MRLPSRSTRRFFRGTGLSSPGWGGNGPARSPMRVNLFRQKISCLRLRGLHPCLFTRLKNQAQKTSASVWHQPHERPACRLKGAEKSKRKKRGVLRIFSVCFKVILQFPAFFQFFSMRRAPPLPLSLRLLQAPSHNRSAGKPLLRVLARPPLSYI